MSIWVSGQDLWSWRQQARQQIDPWIFDSLVRVERQRELDLLILMVAKLDRLALRLGTLQDLPQVELTRSLSTLSELWQKRLQDNVPLQYLLGTVTWRDFALRVAPGVLIPRPETELLIDLAQAACASKEAEFMNWADLGTGSGAISLGLARSFPSMLIHAVDCSEVALAIARQNAQNLGVNEQISFYQGRWLEPLAFLEGKLDGIVSNPPYIPSEVVLTLQPEVVQHEPHLALDGGEDGLVSIREIVSQAPKFLRSGGVLLLEMMMGQGDAVAELLQAHGDYCEIQIYPDLAGIQRFAQAYRI
jgi:release factor glutamine methyltransferase